MHKFLKIVTCSRNLAVHTYREKKIQYRKIYEVKINMKLLFL